MNDNENIYQKLKKKYTKEELAESVMVSEELGVNEEKKAREEFVKLRMERRRGMSDNERLLSVLLTMKYRMKSYLNSSEFDEKRSFGNFLIRYLKIVGRTQKELAQELGLHPSRINRIIKGKEKPGKSIAYRLESHSGELIPAIYWWKLYQKEVAQEIMKEIKERELEKKHVIKVAYQA